MAGRGCCAFFCRGDIVPLTSDILRAEDFKDRSSAPPTLPGAAGKGRPWMVSDLAESRGLLVTDGGAGVDREVGGATGRSHDDCFVWGL